MLHIISPSHWTTSSSLIGLMRLAIRQLYQEEHEVIVIGTTEEESNFRERGIPVLGSIGGATDRARTLSKRVTRYIQEMRGCQYSNIIAWGWHAMVVTEDCSNNYETCAFIDECDATMQGGGSWRVIPTTDFVSKHANTLGLSLEQIQEPLVGVEPSTFSLDSEQVVEELHLHEDDVLISIVGNLGSWQDIIAMAVRLNVAKQNAVFVLPSTYRDRALLMRAAVSHGIHDMIRQPPAAIRQTDVIRHADCAWCPSPASFDCSANVLDVLFASWEETPLACSREHPVASIPTVGSQIAWASDEIEIFGWLLDIASTPAKFEQSCTQRAAAVRAVASPLRFIESLQMRLHALV